MLAHEKTHTPIQRDIIQNNQNDSMSAANQSSIRGAIDKKTTSDCLTSENLMSLKLVVNGVKVRPMMAK